MSDLRAGFLRFLKERLPGLDEGALAPLTSENLLAESVVRLPAAVLGQAKDFVEAAFSLRRLPSYLDLHRGELERRGLRDPGNFSFAMSYDFHLNPEGQLRLIEVNTNAAFLALGHLLYAARGLAQPVPDFNLNEMRENLLEELDRGGRLVPNPKALIIDEDPSSQRLFLEFLVYREIFRSWGWAAEIEDSRRVSPGFDLVYNRDTDFYLESPERAGLRQAWVNGDLCLSPQPAEYLYLADKQRLLEWSEPGFFERMGLAPGQIETLRAHLPRARELTAANAEQIWSERKSVFLKPKRSFGAKQSYRGATISRKHFDDLIPQEILAQEFVPAPEIEVPTPDGPQRMKYDLRFYAYKGRVQNVIARLYQGQVTNLRTPHGGFACVTFE